MNTTRVKHLVEEIQSLTTQYHAEVGSKRKPWPKSIKDRVRELMAMDIPQKKTAELIDIPYATIMSWKDSKTQSKPKFHGLTVRPSPSVSVGPSNSQHSNPGLTVTVRTPYGYTLEVPESIAINFILQLQRGV